MEVETYRYKLRLSFGSLSLQKNICCQNIKIYHSVEFPQKMPLTVHFKHKKQAKGLSQRKIHCPKKNKSPHKNYTCPECSEQYMAGFCVHTITVHCCIRSIRDRISFYFLRRDSEYFWDIVSTYRVLYEEHTEHSRILVWNCCTSILSELCSLYNISMNPIAGGGSWVKFCNFLPAAI